MEIDQIKNAMMRRDVLKKLCVSVIGIISLAHIPGNLFAHVYLQKERKSFVILLGDSIRINYQEVVKKQLENKADIWVPDENCQDSVFVLKNLEKWLAGKKPDVIHINCGLHDVFIENNGLPRRTPEDYGKNLDKIFSILTTEFISSQIIFALTTPVYEERQKVSKTYGRLVRRNTDIDAINKKAIEVCRKYNVKIDDLNSAVLKGGVENLICEDGVHLNEKGKEYVGKRVSSYIEDIIDQ